MGGQGVNGATAIVVAGDLEVRSLLRGLLRLNRLQVEGEAEGATHALELIRAHRPALLVVDATLAEGSSVGLVADARRILPKLRVILVASGSRPSAPLPEAAHRPDVVLIRPFRIRQFTEALTSAGLDTEEGPK